MKQPIDDTSSKGSILMISDHSDPLAKIGGGETGGQNVYVRELADKLVEKGYRVDIFTRLSDELLPREEYSKKGFRVIRIPFGPKGFLSKHEIFLHKDEFVRAAKDYIQKNNLHYDILHGHYWLSGLVGLQLKKLFSIPLVQTFHSLGKVKHDYLQEKTPDGEAREKAETQIAQNCDTVIATCPEEKRVLTQEYKINPEKITIIPVGVNTERFQPYGFSVARAKTKIPIDRNVILFVGRLVPQKDVPTLVRAFGIMHKKLPSDEREKTFLYICGGSALHARNIPEEEKEERTKIKAALRETGCKKYVHFVGRVPNKKLPYYYSAANFCVVPSGYEPFGIVPLEAMACSTPVIVSQVGGLQFSVKDGETGLHAQAQNHEDFAQKIQTLLQDKKHQVQYGKNGRQRILDMFSWDSISDKIITTYRQHRDRI